MMLGWAGRSLLGQSLPYCKDLFLTAVGEKAETGASSTVLTASNEEAERLNAERLQHAVKSTQGEDFVADGEKRNVK